MVEVMAVVFLLGLLAGAAAWSMHDHARAASREKVISAIVHADQMARLSAKRSGHCRLGFDLAEQNIRRVRTGPEPAQAHRLSLPRGVRIRRVVRFDAADKTRRGGVVDIGYSAQGRSPSYAVCVDFTRQRESQWIVFCGLSGQVVLEQDEGEIDKLYESLAAVRADAD